MSDAVERFPVRFETLTISQGSGVLFAEILAPPMNELGQRLERASPERAFPGARSNRGKFVLGRTGADRPAYPLLRA